jgi:hypothetical protein
MEKPLIKTSLGGSPRDKATYWITVTYVAPAQTKNLIYHLANKQATVIEK